MQAMSHHNLKSSILKRGFTVVEILVVAPIVILVIGVFISVIVNMTGDVLSTRSANVMVYNIHDTLSRIEQDVKLSGAYLATNNVTLTSPQGYNNDTTSFHNADPTNGTMLILNSYTTTTNPLTSDRNIVFTSTPNSCGGPQVYQNLPVMMNVIYFVKANTLWRRVVAPSFYETVGCSVPWQQPSCASGVSGALCKTQDIRLVDGVDANTGFVVGYYPDPASTVANTIASDSAQTDSARLAAMQTTNTVVITINATATVAGRDITQTGTVRSVSRNNNTTPTSN